MKQIIVLLLVIATAYAGSPCPTKKIKNCACEHYPGGDEDEDYTEFTCMHIENSEVAGIMQALQNMTIDEFAFARTKLTTLDKDTFAGLNITRLTIDKSPIADIHEDAFRGLPSLTDLSIESTSITKVPNLAHVSHSLQYLSLVRNALTSLKAEEFATLEWVYTIILSENKIAQTEVGLFRDLPRLESLSINDNLIEKLDDWWFPHPTAITYIDVSFNNIVDISYSFFANTTGTLKELDLSDNGLTTLSEEFKMFLVDDNSLYLNGNPIVCDTRLCWIGQILEDEERMDVELEGECDNPAPLEDTPLYELNEDVLGCPKPTTSMP